MSEVDVLQAALPQFYEMRAVPPEVHLPADIDDADAVAEWLGIRAGRRVQVLAPKRGEKRGLVDLATRNATLAYQTRFGQGTTANYEALETLRAVLHLPVAAPPDRVLRYLDDPGVGDGRIHGGVRRRAHAARGVSQVQGARGDRASEAPAARWASGDARVEPALALADVETRRGLERQPRAPSRWCFSTTSPPCARSSRADTASCSRRAVRFPT